MNAIHEELARLWLPRTRKLLKAAYRLRAAREAWEACAVLVPARRLTCTESWAAYRALNRAYSRFATLVAREILLVFEGARPDVWRQLF